MLSTVLLSQVGLDDRFMAADLLGGAFGDLHPVIEDHDPVGDVHHDPHLVLNQTEGNPRFTISRKRSIRAPVSSLIRPPVGSSRRRSLGLVGQGHGNGKPFLGLLGDVPGQGSSSSQSPTKDRISSTRGQGFFFFPAEPPVLRRASQRRQRIWER